MTDDKADEILKILGLMAEEITRLWSEVRSQQITINYLLGQERKNRWGEEHG